MGKNEIRERGGDTSSRHFSKGVVVYNPQKIIFISGTCSRKGGGIKDQADDVFEKIRALLKEAGASWSDVVKTTTFLRDIEKDYEAFNEARAKFFQGEGLNNPLPTSTTVQAKLARSEFLIEIEVTAALD